MYTVRQRVFSEAADGRTILLYAVGDEISDDEARAAGLLSGEPAAKDPPSGLVIHQAGGHASDEAPPEKPLTRMTLAELRALCEAEGIDPGAANLRGEYIEAIEKARAADGGGSTGGDED